MVQSSGINALRWRITDSTSGKTSRDTSQCVRRIRYKVHSLDLTMMTRKDWGSIFERRVIPTQSGPQISGLSKSGSNKENWWAVERIMGSIHDPSPPNQHWTHLDNGAMETGVLLWCFIHHMKGYLERPWCQDALWEDEFGLVGGIMVHSESFALKPWVLWFMWIVLGLIVPAYSSQVKSTLPIERI